MITISLWEDKTNYVKDEARGEPRTWVMHIGDLEICVTRHIHFGKEWILNAKTLGFVQEPLNATDASEAKTKALELVKQRLAEYKEKYIALMDSEPQELFLHGISGAEGEVKIDVSGQAAKRFMLSLINFFENSGAEHFTEFEVSDQWNKFAIRIEKIR